MTPGGKLKLVSNYPACVYLACGFFTLDKILDKQIFL